MISIIIPCYNEEKTIEKLLNKIFLIKLKKQIIIINDGSIDKSKSIINKYKNKIDVVINKKKNTGKGSCIILAKKFIKGKIVIIQDADLEYYPKDYYKLIKPILEKKSLVVYGSRVLNRNNYKNNNFSKSFRVFGNFILTLISNFINNQHLTDAHTCYKVFDSYLFKKICLKQSDFSFCAEVTTKLSLMNIKILEIPIRYKGRSYKDGKKISFSDAFKTFYTLIKYRFFRKFY
jgi:glycosyltransferase involved in cell wall biosynthesis